MIRDYAAVRAIADRIGEIADRVVSEISEYDEQEPVITSSMVSKIRDGFRQFRVRGLRVDAQVLSDRGANSQERRSSANLFGLLNISLDDFSLSKGYLAQAKKIKGFGISNSESQRMVEQCREMLRISPDSYLFTYLSSGIRVFPASSIVAAENSDEINLGGLYSRSLSAFYEIHLTSFVGDPKLGMEPNERMRETVDRIVAGRPTALFFTITSLR